ncbi:glutamate 5-kinase [Acinetobacter pullicarnis]|uniref:glutamate 5-kinase n=1 Tax=Acinetobacter pullicarnis TaxID=2576829 RepID=UPI00111F7E68|nr:glutamate 5-kinase [Acinetobacter pullicarnis]
MGLRDKIQGKLAKAFDTKLSDAVSTFLCERTINSGTYNRVTGKYENQEILKYSGRGVLFGSYNQYEVQSLGVLATDKKATLLQNEVTAEPMVNDEWITPKGKFKVIFKGQDPANTIWKVQLRAM